MALDEEVLRLDGKGIFPFNDESEDEFVDRGNRLINRTDVKEGMHAYANTETYEHYRVHLRSDDVSVRFRAQQQRINERFGCDLSWVAVYYAHLGSLLDSYTLGSNASSVVNKDESDLHVKPPFILINPILFFLIEGIVMSHELIHVPRNMAFVHPALITYPGQRKYEERVAHSPTLPSSIYGTLMHPIDSGQFFRFRAKLKSAFGSNADYILIRTPYEEVKDFYFDGILGKPRDVICRGAESGSLRYRVIKEKIGL